MKKQTVLYRQRQFLFVAVATIVLLFAGSFNAVAQTTYKVGDRAEKMSAGKWVTVVITEVKDDGQYVVRDEDTGISGIWVYGKDLRSIKAVAPTNNRNNNNQDQNQTNANTPATNGGTAEKQQKEESIFERYGSREPRTCEDMKAPAKGAITAALAAKYFICKAEGISDQYLYLVENVKTEVGGGIPYAAIRDKSFPEIDVNHPVYPIRGSVSKYQCKDPKLELKTNW